MKKLLGLVIIFISISSNSFSQTINLECKGSYGSEYIVVIDLENMLLDAQDKLRGFPEKLEKVITKVDEKFIYAETDTQITTWEDNSKIEIKGFIIVDRRLGTLNQEIRTLVDTRDKKKLDSYSIEFFKYGIKGSNHLHGCEKINLETKF